MSSSQQHGRCRSWKQGPLQVPIWELEKELGPGRILAQANKPFRHHTSASSGTLKLRALQEPLTPPARSILAQKRKRDMGTILVQVLIHTGGQHSFCFKHAGPVCNALSAWPVEQVRGLPCMETFNSFEKDSSATERCKQETSNSRTLQEPLTHLPNQWLTAFSMN